MDHILSCYGYCNTCTFCHKNRCFVGCYFLYYECLSGCLFLFLDLLHSYMLNNFKLLFGIFMIISRIHLGLFLSACYSHWFTIYIT